MVEKSKVERSGVEKSGVEKFMVEKSGVEKSGVEKSAGVGKSFNGSNIPYETIRHSFTVIQKKEKKLKKKLMAL